MKSGATERYGSVLVKDGRILGQGRTRAIANKYFRLERRIRQGSYNHAEIEAMNDALANQHEIIGSEIYVAGFFPKIGRLFFKPIFTGKACSKHFVSYSIDTIYVPMPDGWVARTLEQACEEAKEFWGNSHEKRQERCVGEFGIELLEGRIQATNAT